MLNVYIPAVRKMCIRDRPYVIQAAKKFPEVQFLHATGTKAHTEGLSNYHNAFASLYEGRYLAGVACLLYTSKWRKKSKRKWA